MSSSSFQLFIAGEAFEDTNDIAIWYETKSTGLGEEFITDLENSYNQLLSHPFAFTKYRKGSKCRKKSLAIFPYRVFYLVENEFIKIIAIIHQSRSEKFIRRKLK